ncbi:MAG: 2-dehydropantoate 2-reductase [Acidobacteriia bacterium]|nr:2-dehydropantoate 2-reductase [Terriglobia bacterium]
MKFLIAGAGAVGAYMGAKMARAGLDVTLFARGRQLQAIQERGVRVQSVDGDFEARPNLTANLDQVGPVDVLFLTVKAHSLAQLVPQLKSVMGPDTTVVSTQNGIPWWYFQGTGGELKGIRLETIDPGGAVSAAIPAQQVVGSIIYFATHVIEPGVIRHTEGSRVSLGEPDGTRSDRCRKIAAALVASGLRCPVTTHIRREIWVKILGNVVFNPISALTGATLVQMAFHPEVAPIVREIMRETEALGAKLGFELPITIEQRIAGAARVGEHKTSMLQDLEAGRPLELEAIVAAVVELGERLKVPMPHTRTIYACTKLLAEVRTGCVSKMPENEMTAEQTKTVTTADIASVARELLSAHQTGQMVAVPPCARGFDLDACYAVEWEIKRLREQAGHKAAGRKVGFANKAMWRILKLETLVWAHMYDDTVHYANANSAEIALPKARSLKIEPEIMFGLKRPITEGLDAAAALDACEWIAFGFEIIDCPYPDWKFQPGDFVASLGLHSALIVGERKSVTPELIPTLMEQLPKFKARMSKNGGFVEEGSGKNSLRSPALCLAELAAAILNRGQPPLGAGEIVSSGTLTAGHLMATGDTWTAELEGLRLPNLTLRLIP